MAVAVDGTDDGAEVAVAVDADVDVEAADVEVAVELLDAVGDVELVGSVGDVALVVVSEGDVDEVVDVVVDVVVVDEVASVDEVVVDEVVVVLEEVVVSTTGTGNRVSGDDGRTGSGSPGGGKVAAGFCSTTL